MLASELIVALQTMIDVDGDVIVLFVEKVEGEPGYLYVNDVAALTSDYNSRGEKQILLLPN